MSRIVFRGLRRNRTVQHATAALLALALYGAASAAQDEEQQSTGTAAPEASTAPAADPAAKSPPPPGTAAQKSPESFVPSEEISEDLSVSFPVDI